MLNLPHRSNQSRLNSSILVFTAKKKPLNLKEADFYIFCQQNRQRKKCNQLPLLLRSFFVIHELTAVKLTSRWKEKNFSNRKKTHLNCKFFHIHNVSMKTIFFQLDCDNDGSSIKSSWYYLFYEYLFSFVVSIVLNGIGSNHRYFRHLFLCVLYTFIFVAKFLFHFP